MFLIRGEMSKLARMSVGALAVVDVHARDVMLAMADAGVSAPTDFDWISQMRYYWKPTDPETGEGRALGLGTRPAKRETLLLVVILDTAAGSLPPPGHRDTMIQLFCLFSACTPFSSFQPCCLDPAPLSTPFFFFHLFGPLIFFLTPHDPPPVRPLLSKAS